MIEKLTRKLSPAKRTHMTMLVSETNIEGLLFLKAMGLRAIKLLRDRYEETDCDAIVMNYRCVEPDDTLQREMRLINDTTDAKLTALDHSLQREIASSSAAIDGLTRWSESYSRMRRDRSEKMTYDEQIAVIAAARDGKAVEGRLNWADPPPGANPWQPLSREHKHGPFQFDFERFEFRIVETSESCGAKVNDAVIFEKSG